MMDRSYYRSNAAPAPSRSARQILFVLFFILLSVCVCASPAAVPAKADDIVTLQVLGAFETEETRQMLSYINDLRANDAWYWDPSDTERVYVTGLEPLVYDYELERVAMQRAAEIAVSFSHTRPNGESCFTAYPSDLAWGCGENIAIGQSSAYNVFVDWAEADENYAGQGHRRNMLAGGFRSVGIACFQCRNTLCWVQEFSSESSGASAGALDIPVSVDAKAGLISGTVFTKQAVDLFIGHSFELADTGFAVTTGSFIGTVPCLPDAGTWTIADTGIARISGGRLEAVAPGETTLSASLAGMTARLTVRVQGIDPISAGTSLEVSIGAGRTVYYSFVPPETGAYTFSSSGSYDTFGTLYDANMQMLDTDDDSGDGNNFSLSCELTAGKQYFFGARMYSSAAEGTVTVTLLADHAPGFTYTSLSDGSISITGCSLTGDITIPQYIDGAPVTNLAAELFYGASGITSVTIPSTVTYFGTSADDNDWDYVFSYCYDLENIYVDEGNPTFKSVDGILYTADGRTLINYPCSHEGEVLHVDADVLCCTSFASCRYLKFLSLDDPDTWWYTYTFYNTPELTVFYPEGGRTAQKAESEIEAGRSGGTWCTLVSENGISRLPEGTGIIEADAFGTTGIEYLIVPSACRRIAAGAFNGSALKYIRVGADTVIEDGALSGSVVVDRTAH